MGPELSVPQERLQLTGHHLAVVIGRKKRDELVEFPVRGYRRSGGPSAFASHRIVESFFYWPQRAIEAHQGHQFSLRQGIDQHNLLGRGKSRCNCCTKDVDGCRGR